MQSGWPFSRHVHRSVGSCFLDTIKNHKWFQIEMKAQQNKTKTLTDRSRLCSPWYPIWDERRIEVGHLRRRNSRAETRAPGWNWSEAEVYWGDTCPRATSRMTLKKKKHNSNVCVIISQVIERIFFLLSYPVVFFLGCLEKNSLQLFTDATGRTELPR